MTITIPEWVMWLIAVGSVISAGLSIVEFMARRNLKKLTRGMNADDR